MKSEKLQWSDELKKEAGSALADSKLVEVMEKYGVLEKGTFEIQINLIDGDSKPTTSELTTRSSNSGCSYVYYRKCQDCSRDGGTPIGPPDLPSCVCRFC